MDKVQYISLRKKIKDLGMLKQKPWIGVSTLTVETSIFAGLIYLLCQAERFSLSFWLVQVALGISMFRFFALLHECGHKAMFSSRAMNTVAGLYTSFFCLIPYIPWRNLHLQHHRWVGVIDKDPTQAGLLKLKRPQVQSCAPSGSYGCYAFLFHQCISSSVSSGLIHSGSGAILDQMHWLASDQSQFVFFLMLLQLVFSDQRLT